MTFTVFFFYLAESYFKFRIHNRISTAVNTRIGPRVNDWIRVYPTSFGRIRGCTRYRFVLSRRPY